MHFCYTGSHGFVELKACGHTAFTVLVASSAQQVQQSTVYEQQVNMKMESSHFISLCLGSVTVIHHQHR